MLYKNNIPEIIKLAFQRNAQIVSKAKVPIIANTIAETNKNIMAFVMSEASSFNK